MRKIVIAAMAIGAGSSPTFAQTIVIEPVGEGRLRYEQAEQEGLTLNRSDAVTARVRAGVVARTGTVSATLVGQGTLALVDHRYDGLNGVADRPLIADPNNVALYVAQLQYRAPWLTLTGGRQKIALDDERFVGNIPFRDNAQTFDALRAELGLGRKAKLDVSYAWSVRTIWGIDGRGTRQQAVSGNNVFANLSYISPIGTFVGFAYLIDQDEAAVQGYRLSSQTYGGRLAGSRPISQQATFSYQLSYARQSGYHRNPNTYRADYYLADGTLAIHGWKLNGGYEVRGADRGAAFTSFQTPLAANFKFQGWAEKFTTTPPNGVRDYYVGAAYSWRAMGPLTGPTVAATWHRFKSDRLDQHYGNEWNLLASAKLAKTQFSVRYAHYNAKSFATDTQKLWLQADWTL